LDVSDAVIKDRVLETVIEHNSISGLLVILWLRFWGFRLCIRAYTSGTRK